MMPDPQMPVMPLTAVVDFENRKVVYVVNDDIAELREVELGPVVAERVVVVGGIAAGERLVVAGQQQVADGQRVVEGGAS